ncbi:MAG: DUF308 domain-containing protein [Patescibacteria group bacterium]
MNPAALILRGVLALILGIILVIWPEQTLVILLTFFPIFAIVDGSSAIIIGGRARKDGKWLSFIPMGIFEIIIGILVFVWPGITITAFVCLMALWALVLGLNELFVVFTDKKLHSGARWLYVLGSILTIVLGVLVIIYPLLTSLIVLWLLGIYFLVYGILLFVTGIVLLSRLSTDTDSD